jgi:hypothetical protein
VNLTTPCGVAGYTRGVSLKRCFGPNGSVEIAVSWRRKVRRSRLRAEQVSVTREAQHITQYAVRMESRVVTLGQIVFFSTETGDAWVLDPEDGLARCLARAGSALPRGIQETAKNFGIEWETTYRVNGDAMIFVDQLGRERIIVGYPVNEIERAISRMRREK